MTEQPQTDVEKLAHRIAWRYKKSSDPAHSDTYTFNRDTLLQFADVLMAAERERCAKLAETSHPHDWAFIGAAIRAEPKA